MSKTGSDREPGEPQRGNALLWLFLATLFALTPAAAVEVWLAQDPSLWSLALSETGVRTDARRALRLEATLRQSTQMTAPSLLLVGNSVMSENIDAGTLNTCCGPVQKAVVNGLTLLEISMLGEWLERVQPKLVVLAITDLDVYRAPDWEDLRFYDPQVARALTSPYDLVQNSSTHVRGLIQRNFALFRHRQAVLEICGTALGIPWQEMLEVVPNKAVVYSTVQPRPLPSVQTRALGQLAGRLRTADIGLFVFSSPVRAGGARPDAALVHRIEQMDAHLDELARFYGFDFVPAGKIGAINRELYKDALHLMPDGQALLTQRLAPSIKAVLADRSGEPGAL